MKRYPVLGLLALSLSAFAGDASHRLAFSKAENVEVFVDHRTGEPWCGPALQMRFAFGGEPSVEAVERLMPRLGGLLAKECPQAATAQWKSVDASGREASNGLSEKAGGWLALATQPQSKTTLASAPAQAAEPASTQEPAPAAALAPAPAAPKTAAAPVTAPPPAAEPAPVMASAPAPAPLAEVAPAQPIAASVAEPAPQAAAPVVEPVAAPVAAPAPTATEPAVPAAVAVVAQAPRADFSVAGWTPPREDTVLAGANFLTELRDQAGCRYRVGFKPDVAEEFLRVESKGTSCGRDGFANGEGELSIMRSDGVQLRKIKATFNRGLPIANGNTAWPIAGFDDEQNLLLLMGSDAENGVHYLAKLPRDRHNGTWQAGSLFIVALTEKVDLFRNLDTIRSTLMQPVAELEQQGPRFNSVRVYAMRNLQQGLLQGQREAWLYEVVMQRDWRSKQLGFDPNQAVNHLFNHERKQAELAQRQAAERERAERQRLQQVAMQAENELQVFEGFGRLVRDPQRLLAELVNDLDGAHDFAQLMGGRTKPVSLIVRVSKTTDEGGSVDFPYEAQLLAGNTSTLSKGWYLVTADASLDSKARDTVGLPLTQLAAKTLVACEKDGCADLRDPLKLTRHRLGQPEWTPERAKDQVRAVWPDRYAQSGAQE